LRIISKKTLNDFWLVHNDAEEQLYSWFKEVQKLNWKHPGDVKSDFAKASILKGGRVVFNICGNKYRLVVKVNYERGWIFIRFIGTHNQYDKIDAESI